MSKRVLIVAVIDLDSGEHVESALDEDKIARWLIGETVPRHFQSERAFAQWVDDNAPLLARKHGWCAVDDLVGDAYAVALCTSVPKRVDDVDALCAYYFGGPFAGEYDGLVCHDEVDGWGRLFVMDVDFTKSRRDDVFDGLDGLWRHLAEGSQVRKTNRQGPGTKGTRAVEGLRCDFWVAFR